MAENDSSQEKTEEPTAKKKQKARDDGQVARSTEMVTAAVVISVAGFILAFGSSLVKSVAERFSEGFVFGTREVFDSDLLVSRVGDTYLDMFLIVAPIGITGFVAAMLVSGGLGGYSFSMKPMMPKLNKLSPLNGFKRMFGPRALVELLKAIAKFLLIGGLTYLLINFYIDDLTYASLMNYKEGLRSGGSIVAFSFLIAASALILIAMIDAPYQLFEHNKKLKMTKQEVKDEMKDTDGRPEVKQRIREKQREMASMRMFEAIADADVIITNPDHFAVALSYDPTGDMPPKLVAKGADIVAQSIKERAKKEGVPVFASPVLARALFFTTDLNGYVPEPLYEAVAQVIAFIFNINSFNSRGMNLQEPVPQVPSDMRFDQDGRPELIDD
jgi:flagellar biosynthesis protein FlhB